MFYNCKNLEDVNFLCFDTTNVIDMSFMFFGCFHLFNLDLSSFNLNNIMDMSYMFYDCWNLNNLDKSIFKIEGKTKTYNMFSNRWNSLNINNNDKKVNIIHILIDINKDNINKEIYFLGHANKNRNFNFDDSQLNRQNTELYINNKKMEYQKYFIPQKVGEYNIILKLNINLNLKFKVKL
jgi:hypothetical protein